MKRTLMLGVALTSLTVQAEQLTTYTDIKHAVMDGKLIRIVIDYSQCEIPNNIKGLGSYAGAYTPNEIAINNDGGYIAASLTHFTMNNPAFPNQPIFEFNRYTLSKSGAVVLSMLPLSAPNYQPLGDKMRISCTINSGAKVYA